MTKKLLVLRKDGQFREVYEKGRKTFLRLLVVYSKKNDYGEIRVGLVTGRKTGNAVVRNRIRRRLRSILLNSRKSLFDAGALDLVIVARKGAGEAAFRELEKDLCLFIEGLPKSDALSFPSNT
jgi:ribonuclease P protein component